MKPRIISLDVRLRHGSLVLACFALFGMVLGAARLPTPQASEYQIKAAYLYNLANSVDWPANAFQSRSAAFTVCVAEPSPFDGHLSETFRGEGIDGHPVRISILRSSADLKQCHLLFIGTAADPSGVLQKAAEREPILTVGESLAFRKRDGIITFVMESDRIRFDVNREAATQSGLVLSSKVLQVARQVS